MSIGLLVVFLGGVVVFGVLAGACALIVRRAASAGYHRIGTEER